MLIFTYVSIGIMAFGTLVLLVGLGFAANYGVAMRAPPQSEEEEQSRQRIGTVAATLVLIGVLMCGVGYAFR